MRIVYMLIALVFLSASCETETKNVRESLDFNQGWKFKLIDEAKASAVEYDDSNWRNLSVPHDWSIEQGYDKENGAASTGFVKGGMGWYRKHFTLPESDQQKQIEILFDGVYNNASVWINGHFLGKRPNGYSSFSYDLSEHLNFGAKENVIAVEVDRKAYIDSRWYTGSGIYRKVQLIKKNKLHIKQWGVQITTPKVTKENAEVVVVTSIENNRAEAMKNVSLKYLVLDADKNIVSSIDKDIDDVNKGMYKSVINIENPRFWGVEKANLYSIKVGLFENDVLIDETEENFGIRTFDFDANTGFSLNGERLKIKGVNLHHDGGALGVAVPKSIWEYRVDKLKSIGVNAIRMSHNPHAVELMDVCDEKGILVMAEAFDEWHVPKGKSLAYLGDNAAPKEAAKAYPEVFNEWAERDLKDLILRDFNHPSVIMWSIGNEIEWTFPHYSKTFNDVNDKSGAQGYEYVPNYDAKTVKMAFDKNVKGKDPLAETAEKLVAWAKEVDSTRPITCGSVLPSVGMVSGYGTAVDVFGFNYRASDYDVAHAEYPDLKIVGSENWGDYKEWKSIDERDFVAGIFTWTGFAYLGEAGPWPRKGLEISFFDYAGFKTPRGHFFECLWKETPKVYMVTTPESESEFSFSKKDGWKFEMQYTPAPVWKMLRKWEWYKVYPKWNYSDNESIIVQTYTNCEEAELFLNDTSLGKLSRADFAEDNIIKWLVPYSKGTLKVIGYNDGVKVDEYKLGTQGSLHEISIKANKTNLNADGYDTSVVEVNLLDVDGNLITDNDSEIEFFVNENLMIIGIDNGWEKFVGKHQGNKIITHQGKAIVIIQSKNKKSSGSVFAKVGTVKSEDLTLITR
ncbi:sugar-binding domain-containing protein [Flavicella marina]|uniref:sugar-binding domain-containing protein n=1 Tax=Flavicella marina TaxID=1475951 RepID=UPI0012641A0D|nr:sugar-binding domain-containing protein [Flavicella marina]